MALKFGGTGVPPGLRGLATNTYSLPPGTAWTIPSGTWNLRLGKYSSYQEMDSVSLTWLSPGGSIGFGTEGRHYYCNSDGVNFRIANQTGCIVGAVVTNGGSGYVSDPVITPSAGGAMFNTIVGGAVNTSVTITNGGFNYLYPPTVLFSAPPVGGFGATGFATLSGSSVSGITVENQGAGYTSAPTVVLLNDPRDATGTGALAVATLTGAGQVTGVVVTDFGNPTPGTTVPTLNFSGGGGTGAAAFAVMCWCLNSFTISNGGAGLGATGSAYITGIPPGHAATAPAFTNPRYQTALVLTRPAMIVPTLAGGAISAVGTVLDGGIYDGATVVPIVVGNAQVVTTAVSLTAPSFGGQNSTFMIEPA